jgi:hypothetical protein
LIYDYLRGAWVKRKSQAINCFEIINGTLYSGGTKIYEEYKSNLFDGNFIEAFYKCTPFNLGDEISIKIVNYPPRIATNLYYNNQFYVEYTKDYNSTTTKERLIKSKTMKNVLYFDSGYWDVNVYPLRNISAITKLPTSYFKTLQMSFYTKNSGDSFCINNIELPKIKIKQ